MVFSRKCAFPRRAVVLAKKKVFTFFTPLFETDVMIESNSKAETNRNFKFQVTTFLDLQFFPLWTSKM